MYCVSGWHDDLSHLCRAAGVPELVPAGDWQSHVAGWHLLDRDMVQAACEGPAKKGNNGAWVLSKPQNYVPLFIRHKKCQSTRRWCMRAYYKGYLNCKNHPVVFMSLPAPTNTNTFTGPYFLHVTQQILIIGLFFVSLLLFIVYL